jgi:hypothetical protein
MKTRKSKINISISNSEKNNIPKKSGENKYPEYPEYPAKEDIYNQDKEEEDLDPENISKTKVPNQEHDALNEKDFGDVVTGTDLDIPGSELDDAQEDIGSEDEENNYYSIGGDNHNNLDEDKGS